MVGVVTVEIECHNEDNSFHTTYKVDKYPEYAKRVQQAMRHHLSSEGIAHSVSLNPGPGKGYEQFFNCRSWYSSSRDPSVKVRYPRLGAFEVHVQYPADLCDKLPRGRLEVWSKLRTHRWPDPDRLANDVTKIVVNSQAREDISGILERLRAATAPLDASALSGRSSSFGPSRSVERNPPMFFGMTPRTRLPTPVEVRGSERREAEMRRTNPNLPRPPASGWSAGIASAANTTRQRPSSATVRPPAPTPSRPSSAPRQRPGSARSPVRVTTSELPTSPISQPSSPATPVHEQVSLVEETTIKPTIKLEAGKDETASTTAPSTPAASVVPQPQAVSQTILPQMPWGPTAADIASADLTSTPLTVARAPLKPAATQEYDDEFEPDDEAELCTPPQPRERSTPNLQDLANRLVDRHGAGASPAFLIKETLAVAVDECLGYDTFLAQVRQLGVFTRPFRFNELFEEISLPLSMKGRNGESPVTTLAQLISGLEAKWPQMGTELDEPPVPKEAFVEPPACASALPPAAQREVPATPVASHPLPAVAASARPAVEAESKDDYDEDFEDDFEEDPPLGTSPAAPPALLAAMSVAAPTAVPAAVGIVAKSIADAVAAPQASSSCAPASSALPAAEPVQAAPKPPETVTPAHKPAEPPAVVQMPPVGGSPEPVLAPVSAWAPIGDEAQAAQTAPETVAPAHKPAELPAVVQMPPAGGSPERSSPAVKPLSVALARGPAPAAPGGDADYEDEGFEEDVPEEPSSQMASSQQPSSANLGAAALSSSKLLSPTTSFHGPPAPHAPVQDDYMDEDFEPDLPEEPASQLASSQQPSSTNLEVAAPSPSKLFSPAASPLRPPAPHSPVQDDYMDEDFEEDDTEEPVSPPAPTAALASPGNLAEQTLTPIPAAARASTGAAACLLPQGQLAAPEPLVERRDIASLRPMPGEQPRLPSAFGEEDVDNASDYGDSGFEPDDEPSSPPAPKRDDSIVFKPAGETTIEEVVEPIVADGHKYDYMEDCEAECNATMDEDEYADDYEFEADEDFDQDKSRVVSQDGRDYDYAEDFAEEDISNPSVDVSLDDDGSVKSVDD